MEGSALHSSVPSVADATREGVVVLDAQERVLSLDGTAQQIFRCTSQALAGSGWRGLLVDHDCPLNPRPSVTPSPQGGAADALHSGTGRRADGTAFALEWRITSIGAAAAPACFVVLVRDLSAAAAVEQELHMLKSRLRTVVELAPIAIWVTDDDRVNFANRAAARLVGAESGAALKGVSVFSLLREDAHGRLRSMLAQVLLREGELASMPARLVRQDGQTRDVEIALAALLDHGHTTVQMVVTDVTQRNLELRELERSRQALRRLSANAMEAREEERRRIARELHDELGQGLLALKVEIEQGALHSLPWVAPDRTAEVLARLDDVVKAVRRIAADLRPAMLDDLGLHDAIEALANDFGRRLGIQVRLHVEGLDAAPDDKVTIALYRMVQEALTNVARHANATEVIINLLCRDGEVVLDVSDNGVGLPEPAQARDSQFGLLGMRERAHILSGQLEVGNLPEGGARVRVRLPVRSPAPQHPGPAPVQ